MRTKKITMQNDVKVKLELKFTSLLRFSDETSTNRNLGEEEGVGIENDEDKKRNQSRRAEMRQSRVTCDLMKGPALTETFTSPKHQ